MTIHFSEQEREYIIMEQFDWHIKDNCPSNLANSIKKKLKELKKFAERMGENGRLHKSQSRKG